MAAPNTDPLFVLTPRINWAALAGANTSADFTTQTNAGVIFTGGSNGSLLREVRIKFAPGTNTAAAALRLWLNNGSTPGTATNNALLGEVSIPATTASTTGAQADLVWVPTSPGIIIPNGYQVYAALGAYSTGTIYVLGIGGDF